MEREPGRYELTFVPADVRNRPGPALLRRYERVTFDKELITVSGRPVAEFLCPGHPLLDTVVDIVTAHDGGTLLQGALLVDDQDPGDTPRLLLFLEHAITDSRSGPSGQPHIVSRRFEFVTVDPSGRRAPAGPAPYLDCRAATADELAHVTRHLDQSWLAGGVDQAGLDYAIETLVPQHLGEVRGQTETRVDKVTAAVHARLTAAINYWDRRATELSEQARAGRQPRMNPDRARARADELSDRLQRRMAELEQERQLQALPRSSSAPPLSSPRLSSAPRSRRTGTPPGLHGKRQR
jgi:hypothetical protein